MNEIGNAVLLLISEMGSISWQKFCRVVRYMDPDQSPYVLFRTLSRMGHVEINKGTNRIYVSSPAIVKVNNQGKSEVGLLTGARDQQILGRLISLCKTLELDVEVRQGKGTPDSYFVFGDSVGDIEFVSDNLSVDYSENLSAELIEALPNTTILNLDNFEELVKKSSDQSLFNIENMKFERFRGESFRDALYEFNLDYLKMYVLLREGVPYAIEDKNYAIHFQLMADGNSALKFVEPGNLKVNVRTILPDIMDRAFTLFSGEEPTIEAGEYTYKYVPEWAYTKANEKIAKPVRVLK